MNFGILGSNGYLAGLLINNLSSGSNNWVRLPRDLNSKEIVGIDIDVIIDAGFPRNYNSKKVRKEYIKKLRSNLHLSGDRNIPYIYIGTFSTFSPVKSLYSKVKGEAEQIVLDQGGCVIKTGLVVDEESPGGRFAELARVLKMLPVNLRIADGWCPVSVTNSMDFLQTVFKVVEDKFDRKSTVVLCPTKVILLNDLINRFPQKRHTVKLGKSVTFAVMCLAKRLPFGMVDNLKSIAYRQEKL